MPRNSLRRGSWRLRLLRSSFRAFSRTAEYEIVKVPGGLIPIRDSYPFTLHPEKR